MDLEDAAKINLNSRNEQQLRDLARFLNVPGYNKVSEPELRRRIRSKQAIIRMAFGHTGISEGPTKKDLRKKDQD